MGRVKTNKAFKKFLEEQENRELIEEAIDPKPKKKVKKTCPKCGSENLQLITIDRLDKTVTITLCSDCLYRKVK